MRPRIRSFIPAFVAAAVLSCTSGCSGAGQVLRESDGGGGFKVFELQEGHKVEVAHVYKGGKIEYADAAHGTGGIERNGGECSSGGDDFSWVLCFTIVYLFVLMIEAIIDACRGDDDCRPAEHCDQPQPPCQPSDCG